MKTLAFIALVLLAGCERSGRDLAGAKGPAGAGPAPSADAPLGVPACDAYVARYQKCMERMPETSRASAQVALRQTRASWHAALKTRSGTAALVEACEHATRALDTMKDACPP